MPAGGKPLEAIRFVAHAIHISNAPGAACRIFAPALSLRWNLVSAFSLFPGSLPFETFFDC
jgi:hypothetical protein